ncbi:hypothetical protein [Tautonia rosea]|uniref:hypothetical protein n=1 Tax=Tautonia rosea TaxID=2728037 RepID=UPI001474837A|nr:hypothetical protein [Tautonia rosea]
MTLIRGVMMAGKFRTFRDLNGMSDESQRNTLIVEMAGRTNQPVEHYQAMDDATLAGVGAVLVFVREAGIRNDSAIRVMSDDDLRNTLIVELAAATGLPGPMLQSMNNLDLVCVGLGRNSWTTEGGAAEHTILPARYLMTVTRGEVRLTNIDSGESHSTKVPADTITPEQQKKLIDEIAAKLKEYFVKNEADIRAGKIKAEEICGATFALVGTAVGSLVFPPLAPVLGAIASQQGRFYGAMIDDLVTTIKGGSQESLTQFVGVFSTIAFVQYAGALSVVSIAGADGWSILKGIGNTLGDTLADSVNASVRAIGSTVDDVSAVGEDVVNWFVNVLKANRLQLQPVPG